MPLFQQAFTCHLPLTPYQLLRFPMKRMFAARWARAVFVEFHTRLMFDTVLGGRIVSRTTDRACQVDDNASVFLCHSELSNTA